MYAPKETLLRSATPLYSSFCFILIFEKKQQENSSRGDGRFGGFIGGDEDFDDDGECFSDFFTKALGHNLTNCPI